MSCIDAQHAAAPTDAPRSRGEPVDGSSSSSVAAGWAVVNRLWAPCTDRVGVEGGGGCSELLPSSCCLRTRSSSATLRWAAMCVFMLEKVGGHKCMRIILIRVGALSYGGGKAEDAPPSPAYTQRCQCTHRHSTRSYNYVHSTGNRISDFVCSHHGAVRLGSIWRMVGMRGRWKKSECNGARV